MTDQPFRMLDIDFRLNDGWKDHVGNDEKRQVIYDDQGDWLSASTIALLNELNFDIDYAMLWSWPKMWGHQLKVNNHPYQDYYHVDFPPSHGVQVAINYLVKGDPSITEWVDEANTIRHKSAMNPAYKHQEVQLFLNNGGNVVQGRIRKGVPMLIRIDVPHRVITSEIVDTRWVYSLRLKDRNTRKSLKWEVAKERLQHFIIE